MVVLGREARMTFTEREQAMFLRISSMLVYQLATFVSKAFDVDTDLLAIGVVGREGCNHV